MKNEDTNMKKLLKAVENDLHVIKEDDSTTETMHVMQSTLRAVTKANKSMKKAIGMIHFILLDGCLFPPEKRSSILATLGPMTVLHHLTSVDAEISDRVKCIVFHLTSFGPHGRVI